MRLTTKLLSGLGTTAAVAGAVLAGPVITTGAGDTPTSVASAADCHAPGVCGRIHNRLSGGRGLELIHNWGGPVTMVLPNGQNSESYYADTDGFYAVGCVRLWKHVPGNVPDEDLNYGLKCNVGVKITDDLYPGYWWVS